MNADDYMQKRIDDQIKWLSSESGKNQQWFKILRAAEIVMGCAIAYLVSHAGLMPVQVLTGAMGVGVAAIGGLLSVALIRQVTPPWLSPALLPCGAPTFLRERTPRGHPAGSPSPTVCHPDVAVSLPVWSVCRTPGVCRSRRGPCSTRPAS